MKGPAACRAQPTSSPLLPAALHVNGVASHGQGGLLHRFGQRRVRMNGPAHVLTGCAERHRRNRFGYEVTGPGADDVHAQDAVGLRVGQHLHLAVGAVHGAGAPHRLEGEVTLLVGDALLLELLLALADRGDLRFGVDDAGHQAVVDVSGVAGEDLCQSDAVLLGLVRQHGPLDHVPYGVNALHVRGVTVIDLHAAAFVGLDTHVVESQPLGVRLAPDRHQYVACLDRLALLQFNHGPAIPAAGAGHPGTQPELDALPLEDLQRLAGELGVHAGQDAVHVLQDRHPGAQPGPDRAELETDVARAYHHQVLGDLLEGERLRGRDDPLAVQFDSRQGGNARAGSNNYVPGLQLGALAILGVHGDLPGTQQFAAAPVPFDIVLPVEEVDAVGVRLDDGILLGEHRLEVELDLLYLQPVLAQALVVQQLGILFARFEQGLRGDAAYPDAGAAQLLLHLHARHVETELLCPDRCHITARTSANDDEIVLRHQLCSCNGKGPGGSRVRSLPAVRPQAACAPAVRSRP